MFYSKAPQIAPIGKITEPQNQPPGLLAEPNALAKTLDPLAVGSTLLDQFTILELISSQPDANLYRAARLRYCEVCGVENESDRERCGFCGMVLPPPDLFLLTERLAAVGSWNLPPQSFVVNARSYTLSHDGLETALALRAPHPRLAFGYQSDPGLVRGAKGKPNQDSVLASTLGLAADTTNPTVGLFIIADGVGGSAAGQVASRMGIQTAAKHLFSELLTSFGGDKPASDETIRGAIAAAIISANSQIIEWAASQGLSSGTTLTLALVIDTRAFIANVGDSRVYLYRGGTCTQVTNDHSYTAMLVAQGSITREQAFTHPQRNIILRSLGDLTAFEPDLFPLQGGALALQAGDQLMLCSDGLWGMVRDNEISQVLQDAQAPQEACAQLVNRANLAGGADNISVIVMRIE